jgi:hypothetical protein
MSLRIRQWIGGCATGLLLCGAMAAQVTSGTILGTVTDASGGSVMGAKVKITNAGTSISSNLKTNADGNFELPYLIAGQYEVAVEASGFKTFRQTGITLATDEKYRVDIKLEVGSGSQTVTVTASADVLQTDSSELSQTVDRRTVESLPNINDNPLLYAMTMAGVVTTGAFLDPNNVNTGDNSRQYFSGFTVNGSRPISSNIQLDGAFNTNGYVNEIAVIPARDAVGEVKVITNAYSAEYGRAGGGVINFTTKSGDNVLHGSLFENFRNSDLNANAFGNNSFGTDAHGNPNRPRPPFSTNSFGGTLGGPVLLPHLYDGHNKTFFFFSYSGLRRSQGTSAYYTVPTALERIGDFSQTLAQVNVGGQLQAFNRQIYLPFPSTTTVTTVAAGQYQVTRDQASSGGVLNKIPAQYLDPTALKLMSYYPLPNITPLNIDGTSNYFTNAPTHTRSDQIMVKLDRQINSNQKTFFRWTTDWTLSDPPNIFTNPAANNNGPTTQFNPSATIGYDWTISPQSILEVRASVTRINLVLIPNGGLNFLAGNNLGFSPQEIASGLTQVFPRVNISPYPSEGVGNFVLRNNHSTNYSFTPNYTRLLNKWTLKVGGEYVALVNNFIQPFVASMGITNTANAFSQFCEGTGCAAVAANTPQGWSAANFLMGAADGSVGNGQFATGDPSMAVKNSYFALYSQSDWKATRNLTINLGVRWDFQGALTERHNHLSQFDLNATNETNTPGLYIFSGTAGNSRGQTNPDYKNLAPRVGFAYRLGDKTVIRSAYGISYDMVTGMGSGAQGFGSDGFAAPSYLQIRPNTGITTGLDILIAPFENAFGSGGVIAAPNPKNPALLGNAVTAIIRTDNRTPYVQQWNFTIQRLLPFGLDAQVAYVGTKGTFLSVQQAPINQTDDIPQPVLTNAINTYAATGINPLTTQVPNPFFGVITNNTNLNGSTIQQLYLNLPYPAYGAVTRFQDRLGNSNYNSLQITLKHNFEHGFQIVGAYTWSKSINDGGSYAAQIQGGFSQGSYFWDPNNRRLDRSVSSFDIPQRVVLNYLWELPFGKGKPLFSSTPVVSQALSGWKVAGISTFSDGFPIGITGGGFGRPNVIGNPVLPEQDQIIGDGKKSVTLPDGVNWVVPAGYKLYFNPDAFAVPVLTVPRVGGTPGQTVNVANPYYYGSAPRLFSNIRAPGIDNWDLTVSRIITLKERLRLEIRADAYNALNRVQVGAPGSGFGGPDLTTPGRIGMNTSTTFGSIPLTTAQTSVSQVSNSARYMQLSMRLSW